MDNLQKVSIYLDESGCFHNDDDKYFVIGGVIFESQNQLIIKREYRKAVNYHLINVSGYNPSDIPRLKEFKSNKIKSPLSQINILKNFEKGTRRYNSKMFGIIIDKDIHKSNSNLNNRKDQENMRYNYFVKRLLYNLFSKYPNYFNNRIIEFNIGCDERSTKLISSKTLEEYLNIELKNTYPFVEMVSVKYISSKNNSYIQLSDLVAGILFKRVNRLNKFYSNSIKGFKEIQNLDIFSNSKKFDIENL